MMKLSLAALLLLADPAVSQTMPPKCTKVQTIQGEARSQWIMRGEPLPDHWAAYFNKTHCDLGPPGLYYNCNVGDVTGLGYYYTYDSNQAGYANTVFEAAGVKSDAKDIFMTPTKGAFLSDICSKLRGDDPIQQEFLLFDTVGMIANLPTGVSLEGTQLEGQYPYYAEDGRRSTGVTLYTLNEEESKGCKGYMISFGMIITGYAAGEQFTEATPYRDPFFNNTVGCQYDTCKYVGEICKYEDIEGNDNVAEEADADSTVETVAEEDAETVVEEPSPAGSRRLKKVARLVNFVLHMVGF